MPVQERTLHPSPRTGMIPQRRMRGSDRWMDWIGAILLWTGSAAGNVAAFNGGFAATFRSSPYPWQWRASLLALTAGVLMQLVLQWRQFANAHERSGWRYRSAVILSALPSLYTFGPVVTPAVAAWVLWAFGTSRLVVGIGYILGGLLSAILVFGIDILQEVLVVETD